MSSARPSSTLARQLSEALGADNISGIHVEDYSVENDVRAVVAIDMDAKARAEAEAAERRENEMLADVEETMRRHRVRMGRRVTSSHDIRLRREIERQMKQMQGPDGGADSDPSWRDR